MENETNVECETNLENEVNMEMKISKAYRETLEEQSRLQQIDAILRGIEAVPEGQMLCLTNSGNPYLLDLEKMGRTLNFE